MNSLQALALAMSISLITSWILLATISKPLKGFISSLCPDTASVEFWTRFTFIMLFLTPLFFAVSVALPHAPHDESLDLGNLIQRTVTATLVAEFFAMIGMGIWVSSLASRVANASKQSNRQSIGN